MSASCDRAQRYLDGVLPGEERAAFEAHLATCEKCQGLVKSWQGFSEMLKASAAPYLASATPERAQRLVRRASAAPEPARRWPLFALATAAAAAIAVVVTVRVRAQQPVVLDAAEAPLAQTLGDDQIELPAQSRVKVLERSEHRVRLSLERGSVKAHVAHRAPGQTFSVETNGFVVTVVGTRFQVTHTDHGVRVEVTEGRVRVSGPELGEKDVTPGETLESDGHAFTVTEPDAGEVEPAAVEEPKKPKPPSASELEKWKQAVGAKDCSKVLPDIHRAVRENPQRADPLVALADCQRVAGAYRDAVKTYERAIQVSRPEESDRTRLFLARYLHEHADDAAAERMLRVYLQRRQTPDFEASGRVLLGRVLIAEGKKAQARTELQRVTKSLPSSAQSLEALDLLKSLR